MATLGATCLDLISYHQYCKLLHRRHKHLPIGRSDYMSAIWKPKYRSQISVPAPRTVIINAPAGPWAACVWPVDNFLRLAPCAGRQRSEGQNGHLLRDPPPAAGPCPPRQAGKLRILRQAMDHWSHQEARDPETTSIQAWLYPFLEILQKQGFQRHKAKSFAVPTRSFT